ncbi:MAG: VWA domain-containing protein [Planctomycetota bacterium]
MKSPHPTPNPVPTVEALPESDTRALSVLALCALGLAGAACWASLSDRAAPVVVGPPPRLAVVAEPEPEPLPEPDPAQTLVTVEPGVEEPQVDVGPQTAASPRIEVAFVLDTTGSMGSLLETAKQKIWGIVNVLATARPQTQIALGLVAYRDAGEAYVAQSYPLTEDLDSFYAALMALQPVGGGDAPEAVLEALAAAAKDMQWTARGARTVFLVGDAPPHPETLQACLGAQAWVDGQGQALEPTRINTILCGADRSAGAAFQSIAGAHTGEFVAIEPNPAAHTIQTPYDAEIVRLQAEIEATVLAYGSAEDKARVSSQQGMNYANSAEVQCQRASALTKTGGFYSNDLLWAVENSTVVLDELDDACLPDELRGLKPSARREALEALRAKREAAKRALLEVVAQRDGWIAQQPELQSDFEREIQAILASQLAEHGFYFGC